jgi:hypothetical protein
MVMENDACDQVGFIVLITCISFTIIGEFVSLYMRIHTTDKSRFDYTRFTHIMSSGLALLSLITGFVQHNEQIVLFVHNSIGFSFYSVMFESFRALTHQRHFALWTLDGCHVCFYVVSMYVNLFLCVYGIYEWSFINSAIITGVTAGCFITWSVLALLCGLERVYTQYTIRPSCLAFCGSITNQVARLTVIMLQCAIHMLLLVVAVSRLLRSTTPPAFTPLVSYFLTGHWVLHYIYDRLELH